MYGRSSRWFRLPSGDAGAGARDMGRQENAGREDDRCGAEEHDLILTSRSHLWIGKNT